MKLKPCPFCGGEAINDHDSHPIYCGSCYMSMPYGVCENDMISLWNTRIADPEVERLTELLDDVCNYARRNPTSAPQCITDLVEALK